MLQPLGTMLITGFFSALFSGPFSFGSFFLFQMGKDLFNYLWIFDVCY